MTAAGPTGSTGLFSETFRSHDLARKAAERAAREQVVPGVTTGITYEDAGGHCTYEVSAGDDRPETGRQGLTGASDRSSNRHC